MNGADSGGEKRRFDRIKVNITLNYHVRKPLHVRMLVGEEEVEATTLDLGEGGMAIMTKYDLPIETLISIEFMVHEEDNSTTFKFYRSIFVQGEVKSNVLLGDNNHRIGISFQKIDEEDREEISRFVKLGITYPKIE